MIQQGQYRIVLTVVEAGCIFVDKVERKATKKDRETHYSHEEPPKWCTTNPHEWFREYFQNQISPIKTERGKS